MLYVNCILIKIKLNSINEIKLSATEKKKKTCKVNQIHNYRQFSLKKIAFIITVCFTAQMTIINSMNFQGICSHSLPHSNTCGRWIPETSKQNKSCL